jgi:protein O-mannosyl-transferase
MKWKENLKTMNRKNQIQVKNQNPQKKFKREINIEKLFSSNWFILLLLFVATLIVYSNSFNVPFQFDDEQQIVYQDANYSFQNFTHLSYWVNVNNRPISTFTLVANFILNGNNVFGYHIVNFIIHLLSGVILFFWLKLITSYRKDQQFSKWLPVVISLFFLVHPVQTQSVTYIVQRMTSLAGMFFLLSVFLYTKGRFAHFRNSRTILIYTYYALAVIAGIMGTLSKQNAVVFPLAMLLSELFFIRNKEGKICKRYLIFVSSVGFIIAFVLLIKFGLPFETKDISRSQYFATQMIVIPRYFQMMLIPFGLSIDHGVQVVKNFFEFKAICGASFLIGILLFAIFWIKKNPLVSFGLFWVFITLIIESSIFPIRDVMFDQRMYLPLVGFSIALWALVFDFFTRRRPKLLAPIILFILIALSIGTYARNNVWRSRVDIWEKVTEMYPDHFRGWQGLGRAYVATGEKDISKIIKCYERALQIEPDNQTVLNDLAANYLKISKTSQAIECFKKLEKSDDLDYKIYALRTLGIIYLSQKEYDLSTNYLKRVIKINPVDTSAFQGLSSLYIQTKDFKNAIYYSKRSLEISPNEMFSLLNIGLSYINVGRSDLSKQYLLKALTISPVNVKALILYANACVNTSNFDEAIVYLKKAFDITKDNKLLLDIEKVEKMKP